MARLESAIRVVLEFKEAFNRHDLTGMMQLLSSDCIFDSPDPAPDGTVYSGKEAIIQFWRDFFNQSPDAHLEIEDSFSLGERCVMRWIRSSLEGAEKKVHVRGVDLFRVRSGLICEQLSYVKG